MRNLFLSICILLSAFCAYAKVFKSPLEGYDISEFAKTHVRPDGRYSLGICFLAPTLESNYSQKLANVKIQSGPYNTGYSVNADNVDKSVSVNWIRGLKGLNPRKYLVMTKVDPRFDDLQMFIQKYDYAAQKYSPLTPGNATINNTITQFNGKSTASVNISNVVKAYKDYFDLQKKSIPVKSGDIVNIVIMSKAEFNTNNFLNGWEYTNSSSTQIYQMFNNVSTISGNESDNFDNTLLAVDVDEWCKDGSGGVGAGCQSGNWNSDDINFMGVFQYPVSQITSKCDPKSSPKSNGVCRYKDGGGIMLYAGSSPVSLPDMLMPFDYNDSGTVIRRLVGQYTVLSNGNLFFDLSDQIKEVKKNMVQPFNSLYQWQTNDTTSNLSQSTSWQYLIFGRHFFKVDVGTPVNNDIMNKIKLYYTVASGGISSSTQWIEIPNNQQDIIFSSSDSGTLYFKAAYNETDPDYQISDGGVMVYYKIYEGSTVISKFLYRIFLDVNNPDSVNYIFRSALQTTYTKVVLKIYPLLKSCLTLYVLIYGLYFLLGAVQIQAYDLLMRMLKLITITVVINPSNDAMNSYNFVNEYFFKMFYEGMGYILKSVMGSTVSQPDNVFVFVDQVFNYYTNPFMWLSIVGQILGIFYGTFVIGLANLSGVLFLLKSIFLIMVEYMTCLMTVYMLLIVAPIFVLLLLFGVTKEMFKQWIAALLLYVLRPLILAVMVLLVANMSEYLLSNALTDTCIRPFIQLSLTIDFENIIGVNYKLHIDLPISALSLPIADIQNNQNFSIIMFSFLHYCLSFVCHKLTEYTDKVISYISGAQISN